MRRLHPALAIVVSLIVVGCATTGGSDQVTQQSVVPIPSHLPGSSWRLVSMDGYEPALDPNDYYTLSFDNAGRISGTAACNRIFGSYSVTADRLVLSDIASTRAFCVDAPFSDAFPAALGSARQYSIANGVLTIELSGGGRLTFSPDA